jgi:TRAP-type mannitol/chloroaromatic compound transport system permease small subunit
MAVLLGLVRGIDRLNEWAGKLAGYISLLMVVVVTGDVVMRYAFDTTFVAVQELEWHLFGAMFLLGAGYTLLKDEHVRVDVVYQRLGRKARAWINLLGVLFFLLPGCFLVLDTSWKFFSMSLAIHEGSGDPGGLPARYVLKAFILVGFALVALQGVSMGVKAFLEIMGRPCEPAPGTTKKAAPAKGEGA